MTNEIYKKPTEDNSGNNSGRGGSDKGSPLPPSGITPDRSFEGLQPMQKLLTGLSLAAHEIRKREFLAKKAISGSLDGEKGSSILSKIATRVFGREKRKKEIDEFNENPVSFDVSEPSERCIVPKLENGKLTVTMPLTAFYHRRYYSEIYKANVSQTVSGALRVPDDLLAKSRKLLDNENIRNDIIQHYRLFLPLSTSIYTFDGKYCGAESNETLMVRKFAELLGDHNILDQLIIEFVDFDNLKLGGKDGLVTENGLALKLSLPAQ